MKIIVIAPTPYFSDRGCHIRIYEQLMALHGAGHSAEVFTYHLGRDEGPFPVHRIPHVERYTKTSAGPAWGKLYLDLLLLRLLWQHRKRLRTFDIVHAHLHEGGFIGWIAKSFLKLPIILDAQGSLVGELQQHSFFKVPGLKWAFKQVERFIVKRADHIFTSSQASFDFIDAHYPTVRNRLTLLEDAVARDMRYPKDASDLNELRSVLHLSDQADAPTIIYTGGLSKIKGIDYILESIPRVLESIPNAQFIIAGFPHVERCQSIVKQLGVADAVRFTLRINYFDLPKYLALADIAIDPKPGGAGEASGKALNYMAAGLPIVAFNSVNAQAMMHEAALLVEQVSAADLADGMIELLGSPERMQTMNQSGIERIQKHYSWDHRISIATTVYEQLTS